VNRIAHSAKRIAFSRRKAQGEEGSKIWRVSGSRLQMSICGSEVSRVSVSEPYAERMEIWSGILATLILSSFCSQVREGWKIEVEGKKTQRGWIDLETNGSRTERICLVRIKELS